MAVLSGLGRHHSAEKGLHEPSSVRQHFRVGVGGQGVL